jgi:hypothetical protein
MATLQVFVEKPGEDLELPEERMRVSIANTNVIDADWISGTVGGLRNGHTITVSLDEPILIDKIEISWNRTMVKQLLKQLRLWLLGPGL